MIRKLHIYPYFKKSKHAITKFPKGIQYDYSCPLAKDNTTQHTAQYHPIPPNTTQHTAEYHPIPPNTTQHTAEQRIRYQLPTEPRREEYDRNESQPARRQNGLLCTMAFQELEWHAIDDVDFDDESDIPEVVPKSGTPILNDMDPIWTSD